MTIDAKGAEAGGVLPWLNDTVFFDEFEVVLDTLRVGGVAGPFKSRLGWHLVRLDSVRSRADSDLAKEGEQVKAAILGNRSRDNRQQCLDDYRKRYRLQMDTTAIVQTVTEAEVAAFLGPRLAPYKRPARIVVLDQLPAAPTGKILKARLKAIAESM